jgi:hypothetical protein
MDINGYDRTVFHSQIQSSKDAPSFRHSSNHGLFSMESLLSCFQDILEK